MKEKNFGLLEDEFINLTVELKNGNELLFKKIFLKQFEPALFRLMSKYRIPREKAYDMVMDTMIHFRKLLLADKIHYGNLNYLFHQIASQTYLKQIEKNKRIQSVGNFNEAALQSKSTDSEILEKLSIAWKKLGTDCQVILKHYFYDELKLYQIAEILNRKPEAIRKQKTRCVHRLRSNIRQHVQLSTTHE